MTMDVASVMAATVHELGGRKRGFWLLARALGVSERVVKSWRYQESVPTAEQTQRILEFRAERLAAALAETRAMLNEQEAQLARRGVAQTQPLLHGDSDEGRCVGQGVLALFPANHRPDDGEAQP